MIVLLHFGDGSYKEIDMPDTEDVLELARDWVLDNAWLEDEDGNEVKL